MLLAGQLTIQFDRALLRKLTANWRFVSLLFRWKAVDVVSVTLSGSFHAERKSAITHISADKVSSSSSQDLFDCTVVGPSRRYISVPA